MMNSINSSIYFKRKPVNVFRAIFPFKWIWAWLIAKVTQQRDTHDKMALLVMDGLQFGECPRIHAGNLYVSDFYEKCVYKIDIETNEVKKRIDFEDTISGTGFLPDGRMLVVGRETRCLYCYDDTTETTSLYTDLKDVTRFRANDMVIDDQGNAYVGNFGFDVAHAFTTSSTTTFVRVDPNRNVHIEATDIFFPNGSVITPDGKTLLLCETFSGCILIFDRDPNTGTLSNRRIWVDIGTLVDGCCLDAEGCLWVAIPQVGAYKTCGCFIRVNSKGEILERFGFNRNGLKSCSIACTLATKRDGTHWLYVVEAETIDEFPRLKQKNSRVKAIQVSVGPAIKSNCVRYCGGYC
jgi:sugar lactone lactonase YvrE